MKVEDDNHSTSNFVGSLQVTNKQKDRELEEDETGSQTGCALGIAAKGGGTMRYTPKITQFDRETNDDGAPRT